MVTIRVRSMVWFATGAVLALFVSLTVMQAWRVDAAPGDTDTTFVSMTSCRLADTRLATRVGPNAGWGAEETKTLQATGVNGNCTIPSEASGLLLKVFALNATGEGFLTVWADGDLPLGSALNPSPGGLVFSAVTTDLSPTGSFKLFNKTGSTDVIIDVNGYYTKESLQDIDSRLTTLEAEGPEAIPGYEVVEGPITTVAGTFVFVAEAECPSGKVALGGGGAKLGDEGALDQSDWEIRESRPKPDGSGWQIELRPTNTVAEGAGRAYAVCATGPTATTTP